MIKLTSPYIIAEIGINHEGKLGYIKKLIKQAKEAGADAVKFQAFDPNTIAFKDIKKNKLQKKSLRKRENLSSMWKRVMLDKTKVEFIAKQAKKNSIDLIFSVFDDYSINLIKKIKIKAIKIASSDINDHELIKKVKKFKVPIIISTGMASFREIRDMISLCKIKPILLHCVSLYPCPKNKANLKRILGLKKKFDQFSIGYSDHTIGADASIIAVTLGASVIEKHFTLNKNFVGADHLLSADKNELKVICDFKKNYQNYLGVEDIEPSNYEKNFKKYFRKSIYCKKNISKGEIFSLRNLIIRRPQGFLKPYEIKKIIGKKSKFNFKEGQPIKF